MGYLQLRYHAKNKVEIFFQLWYSRKHGMNHAYSRTMPPCLQVIDL